jgi:hypothetical protein
LARPDNKRLSGALANPAPDFPIIISEWRRNTREVIRISLDEFNRRQTIDVRAWWLDPKDDTYKPARGGITLAVAHLPALADGLALALAEAQQLGLIEAPTPTKDPTATERQR